MNLDQAKIIHEETKKWTCDDYYHSEYQIGMARGILIGYAAHEQKTKVLVEAFKNLSLLECPHDTIDSFKLNEMRERYIETRHAEDCRICKFNNALKSYQSDGENQNDHTHSKKLA